MTLIPGLISLQFLGVAENGNTTSNTVHILNSGAGSAPDYAELLLVAQQAKTQFDTTYRACGSTVWTWASLIARNVVLPTTVDVYQEATVAVNEAGTRSATGTHIPTSICSVASLRTPNASRRFRGHLFLPPAYTASSVTGDGLNQTDAYWTNCGAFCTELNKGTPGGAGWTGSSLSHYELVIYSRVAALAAVPYVANVQTCVLRGKASFLRSRERGGT